MYKINTDFVQFFLQKILALTLTNTSIFSLTYPETRHRNVYINLWTYV